VHFLSSDVELVGWQDFWTEVVVSVHDVHMPMLAIGGHVHLPMLQVWKGSDHTCYASELSRALKMLPLSWGSMSRTSGTLVSPSTINSQ
jgi:hypothetical protein